MKLDKNIKNGLENIYISPLELCNLSCRYCYTKKTQKILSNQEILTFINNYSSYLVSKKLKLKSVLFCGGEVFTLKDFPDLVNTLIEKDIFISIITNGTINCINQIKEPKNCQLLVSLDGPADIHDKNRGQGNYVKSITFIKSAIAMGFPVEIMFLVTKDSYRYRDSFNVFDLPKTYLTDRLLSLSNNESLNIKKNYQTFPSKNFGCLQLSLHSNGMITGCCESSLKLGDINNNPSVYVSNFSQALSLCSTCQQCQGCCDPTYLCGYKKEFNLKTCQQVVKLFK